MAEGTRSDLPPRAKDLTGLRFGRWTSPGIFQRRDPHIYWLARCDCGVARWVRSDAPTGGRSTSCGCYAREVWSTHGAKKSPEWEAWSAMRKRCTNPNHRFYHRYGGRGIGICERWSSFERFLEDMGSRPSSKHSLDRIDNDGNYSPENCRWATQKEQMRNRSANRIVTVRGEQMCLADAVDRFAAASYATVQQRLDRGWDIERALTQPPRRMLR